MKKRYAAFFLSSLPPLAVMGLGLYLFSPNFFVPQPFLISFLAIPLIAVALLALCTFSKIKLPFKAILVLLILFAFAVSFLVSFLQGPYEKVKHYTSEEAAWHYTSADNLNKLMPSLTEIGNPEKIEYIDFEAIQCFFLWDAEYLVCQYSPEEYAQQKMQLEKTYSFREKSIALHDYQFEPSAEIDGYHFRLLADDGEYESYIDYPKYMVLVSYSDEAQKIIYLSYFDTDLDYITSLTDFLHENCGWKHVQ